MFRPASKNNLRVLNPNLVSGTRSYHCKTTQTKWLRHRPFLLACLHIPSLDKMATRGCITNSIYVVLFTFLVMYLGCVQYLHYNSYFLYYGYDQKYCSGIHTTTSFNFLCIPFK